MEMEKRMRGGEGGGGGGGKTEIGNSLTMS